MTLLHYVLPFVKLLVTVSISLYIMCITIMFVQHFEPQGRPFTNFHYYFYFAEMRASVDFLLKFEHCKLVFVTNLPSVFPAATMKLLAATIKLSLQSACLRMCKLRFVAVKVHFIMINLAEQLHS